MSNPGNGSFPSGREPRGDGLPKRPKVETKTIEIEDPVPLRGLATALGQNPFRIIADLIKLGQYKTVNSLIDFETASKVIESYGHRATKIG